MNTTTKIKRITIMKDLILANYNYGSGRVTAHATDHVESEYDELWFTLTVTFHDPGDVVTVDLEYQPGSLIMDGLRVDEKYGLDWLDRLVNMKREEVNKTDIEAPATITTTNEG